MTRGDVSQRTAASVLAVLQGMQQATVYNVTVYGYLAFCAVFASIYDKMPAAWQSLKSLSTDFFVVNILHLLLAHFKGKICIV